RLLEAQETASSAAEDARTAQAELEQFDSVLERLEAKRNEQRRLVAELDDPEQPWCQPEPRRGDFANRVMPSAAELIQTGAERGRNAGPRAFQCVERGQCHGAIGRQYLRPMPGKCLKMSRNRLLVT